MKLLQELLAVGLLTEQDKLEVAAVKHHAKRMTELAPEGVTVTVVDDFHNNIVAHINRVPRDVTHAIRIAGQRDGKLMPPEELERFAKSALADVEAGVIPFTHRMLMGNRALFVFFEKA